jgi:type IV pilus assembly protein PilX
MGTGTVSGVRFASGSRVDGRSGPRSCPRQSGSSLVVVLIVLTVLLLGSALVMRSGETVTLMVGNSAQRDAGVRAADLGVNQAFSHVRDLSAEELDAPPRYFATRQSLDSTGLPSTVAWSQVPGESIGNHSVQWVVERMCQGPLPVTDVLAQCQVSQSEEVGSQRGGWGTPVQSDPIKYFRVTVRVTGPRGTEQFIQTLTAR